MIRRLFLIALTLSALAAPAAAKDELVLGMTQTPGTWNPLISSMLAKSLISNMTARPLTAYDANSNLVCLVCTDLPTVENGKARVIDLPDDGKGSGKKGMEVDVEMRDMKWGDGVPVTAKDVAFTLEVGKHPLSGVASSEGYKRILKLDIKDDRHFTMTIDRVTFDYNSLSINLVPAHIEKPIFDADPAEYRNKTAYDTDSTNPGLAFGPYRI
ncbi:MAG TPA: ABC transporter substrate-binding protein, partial [Reyranella sp.]